ncbi:MAG: hypothetical protein NWP84_01575, partial [Cyanobium sp. MAG_04]|nr:hypothetical protein [Cyanobium sp. MAG_04]
MSVSPQSDQPSGGVSPFGSSPQELYLDPEMLAQELAEELRGDPLDDLDSSDPTASDVAAECDLGLALLRGDAGASSQEQCMHGLRIFCEHRDPRALPLLQLAVRHQRSCYWLLPAPSAVTAVRRRQLPELLTIIRKLLS